MDQATKNLLCECSSGCKMAVDSMNQVSRFISEEKFKKIIADCKEKHEQLDKKVSALLKEGGETGKQPGMAASAFSWMTTEIKMKLNQDDSQAAKLMMNGCNMGIQSISEIMNQNACASKESRSLAQELVKTEEDFLKELEQFL